MKHFYLIKNNNFLKLKELLLIDSDMGKVHIKKICIKKYDKIKIK